jgi:hypothetical protein
MSKAISENEKSTFWSRIDEKLTSRNLAHEKFISQKCLVDEKLTFSRRLANEKSTLLSRADGKLTL